MEGYHRFFADYYCKILRSLNIGYFSRIVFDGSGEDRMRWEERWISPFFINFSQTEIHPFFHGRGPVEEVLRQIWSEEVSSYVFSHRHLRPISSTPNRPQDSVTHLLRISCASVVTMNHRVVCGD